MNSVDYMGLNIPYDDVATWDFLCAGENLKGIFQLETSSAATVLKKIRPRDIKDLALVNALNRPGAMAFTDELATIRKGEKKPEYVHERLEPYLNETMGRWVYQESVLRVCKELAGFSASDSATALKAMGKKDEKKLKSLEQAFKDGMVKNGFPIKVPEELFKQMLAFANYGFNKSHAVSYSQLGYISAYIKLHYPLQFFTSALNYCQYEQKPLEEIAAYVAELESFGIKILPPSVQKLSNTFVVEDGAIRYPVGLVKSVGDAVYERLKTLTSQQTATLDAFMEAAINAGINSRSMECIIISGALDCYNVTREDALFYYWFLSELQPEVLANFWHFKNSHPLSEDLVFKFVEYHEEIKAQPKSKKKQLELFDIANSDAAKVAKKIRYRSYFKTEVTRTKVLKNVTESKTLIQEYKKNLKVAYFLWETYALGFSFNYHLNRDIRLFRDIQKMKPSLGGSSIGFVEEIKFKTSAKGNLYAHGVLKLDTTLNIMLFSEVCEGAKDVIREGDLVSFTFTKLEDKLKIESIRAINNQRRIYEFYTKHEKESSPNE